MSNIIQSVSITKHINPSKQVSDEYTLMIGYHDVIYITKIKQESFKSNLFEFDMLEQLIYNSNHKQKVGDVDCDMEIKESEAFGKVLDVKLLFERDVKPMKKINEEHPFQLQEKKLDYDDKIGLAMTNLRSEINFVEIKPTTKIVTCEYVYNYEVTSNCTLKINNNHPEYKTDIQIYLSNFYNFHSKVFILDRNVVYGQSNYNFTHYFSKPEYTKNITLDPKLSDFNKFTNWNTNVDVHWELLQYVKKTFFTPSGELIDIKFESALDFYLKNNYVDMIKIKNQSNLIIFIDETKKPNNRKIKFYKSIDEFEQSREQFKSYHILDMESHGILIEEID
jgi:hypothetical protein